MDVSRDDKLQQLEKVLQSRVLHGSESLKAFLRYVVENAVDHREIFLKEYTIATEVFGRDRSYDSRNDSVVRVQAGRLRTKLHEYYAEEGVNDKVVIDLPKGHYTPVFSYNPQTNGGQSGVAVPVTVAAGTGVSAGAKWWRVATGALFLLCAALGLLALSYRSGAARQNPLSIKAPADSGGNQSAAALWDDVLHSNEPVLVAFSNTRFQGTAETGMKLIKPLTTPELGAESSGAGPARAANDDQVVTEHYTGVGEVMGVYALSDLFCRFGHSFRLKRSLLLNWEDLKTENIVILGSPAENILIRDLPQAQDFVFGLVSDDGQGSAFGLSNTRPQAGEQKTYLAKQEGPSRSQISEDYALISLLRGLESDRRLLILAGITTFGTQAAAEYVTKPEYIKDLTDRLNVAPPGQPPKLPSYYQVVIKVKVNGGVPVQIFYVTHHVLQ
jgi:hypothetical protein